MTRRTSTANGTTSCLASARSARPRRSQRLPRPSQRAPHRFSQMALCASLDDQRALFQALETLPVRDRSSSRRPTSRVRGTATGSNSGSNLSKNHGNWAQLNPPESRPDAPSGPGTVGLGAGRSQVQILSPRPFARRSNHPGSWLRGRDGAACRHDGAGSASDRSSDGSPALSQFAFR